MPRGLIDHTPDATQLGLRQPESFGGVVDDVDSLEQEGRSGSTSDVGCLVLVADSVAAAVSRNCWNISGSYGVGGPTTGVSAVLIDVAATSATAGSVVNAYPDDGPASAYSFLRFNSSTLDRSRSRKKPPAKLPSPRVLT